MKRFIIFTLLFLISGKAFSTNQVEDILIWDKDTLYLYDSPLEQFQNITQRISNINPNFSIQSTDCYRGFYAEWKLIGNELFLYKINECNSDSCLNQTIQKVLGRKFKNGLLKADWVEGNVWCGWDRIYEHSIYISHFRHEYNLVFIKGLKTNINEYHFKPCDTSSKDRINNLFIENLDWDNTIRLKNQSFRIRACVVPNENGKAISVSIMDSPIPEYRHYFIQAIEMIPCIANVYYYKGEPSGMGEEIEIVINNNKTKKYGLKLVQ